MALLGFQGFSGLGRAGHLHRDPNSDTAAPDPKLPAPTCLVNITWIVARAEPSRSETRQAAKARHALTLPMPCHAPLCVISMLSASGGCEGKRLLLPLSVRCWTASELARSTQNTLQSAASAPRPWSASRSSNAHGSEVIHCQLRHCLLQAAYA